ncbi:ATP-binding cassette domain-containing protein [Halobellus sp. GM3]|uniref:ATP-binding cassette domain-containing protein n=1 Tax=Halobellus sp. GM3 TaxID=3458410 RepID=UPI00403D60F4
MLEVSGLTKRFGSITAVDTVGLEIDEGEIVGLIGPNGAGKTTLFNLLTGIYEPTEGSFSLDGRDLTGLNTGAIAQAGIGRTFQIVRTFNDSTVRENLLPALMFGRGEGLGIPEAREKAMEYLTFVGLADKADEPVTNLTTAERRSVELARALSMQPRIILLDESASGLNPSEVQAFSESITEIRDEYGISIFWVEHIMDAIMGTVDRIIVLHHGQKIAEGTPEEIRNNEKVSEAYFGEVV